MSAGEDNLRLLKQLHLWNPAMKVWNTDDNLLPTPPRSPKISLPSIPRSSAASSMTSRISTKSTLKKDESVYSRSSSAETLTPDGSDSISLREMFPTPPDSILYSLPSVPRSSLSSNDGHNLTMYDRDDQFHSLQRKIGVSLTYPGKKSPPTTNTFDILDSTRYSEMPPVMPVLIDKPSCIAKLQGSILSNNSSELPIINRLHEVTQVHTKALSDSASITSLPTPPRSPKISLPSVPRSSSTSSLISTYPSRKLSHRNNKRISIRETLPKPSAWVRFDDYEVVNGQQIVDQEFIDSFSMNRDWPRINQSKAIVEEIIPEPTSDILPPVPPRPPKINLPSVPKSSISTSEFPVSERSQSNLTPPTEEVPKGIMGFKCASNEAEGRCYCFKCCCCCIIQ